MIALLPTVGSDDFLTADAALQVADQDELESRLRQLLTDAEEAGALGERAAELVRSKRGCLKRSVALIHAMQ